MDDDVGHHRPDDDGARAGVLLRRDGPEQVGPEHADDELHLRRHCRIHLDPVRLLGVVRQLHDGDRPVLRQPVPVLRVDQPHGRQGSRCRRRRARSRGRRVPGHVRCDHGRADHGCDRRPDQVGQLGRLHPRMGDRGVLPARAHGLGGGLFSPTGKIAGWLSAPIDFAGGTVVHIDAGAAALALVILLGKRKGWPGGPFRPHNLPFVMLGAALLWVGWFGFNAGSEGAADGTAGRAWINTFVATAVAMLTWLLTERFRDGHATSLGAASGMVAGLVAITLAAAAVDSFGAIAIGGIAGVVCALAIGLKYKLGYDDALDVVGVHLVGGITGTVLIGLFATHHQGAWYPAGAKDGLFYGGGVTQLLSQIVVAASAVVFSFVMTYIIGLIIKRVGGLRLSEEVEVGGIDLAVHGETAYESIGATRLNMEVHA